MSSGSHTRPLLPWQQTDSGRTALVTGTIDRSLTDSVDNNILNRQLTENNSDVANVLMKAYVCPPPIDRERAVPVMMTSDCNYLYPPPTAPYLGMSSAAATDHIRPPPAQQTDSDHALPEAFGLETTQQQLIAGLGDVNSLNVLTYDRAPRAVASNMTVVALPPPTDRVHALPAAQQQLTSNFCIDNATVFDRAPPLTASDLTTGTIPPQTLVSTGYDYLQPRLPHVPFCAAALPARYSMPAVNTDHALPVVNISQFSTMIADRRGVAMPILHCAVCRFNCYRCCTPCGAHFQLII